ncbi:MAG: GAF domain-containing protein [Actinobacteria bacterium]|nr:GAF domain-containing protein [Actinomycetota bacterium]
MKASDADVAAMRATPPLVAELATAIVANSLDAVGADAGFVATVAADGRTLDVRRVTPQAHEPVRLSFARAAPYPIAHTMRTGNRLVIASDAELCDHPGLVRVKNEDDACATMPLFGDDGELLGAINLAFEDPHAFTEDELDAIEALARHCAEAMTFGRRIDDDVTRRAAARSPTP